MPHEWRRAFHFRRNQRENDPPEGNGPTRRMAYQGGRREAPAVASARVSGNGAQRGASRSDMMRLMMLIWLSRREAISSGE